MTELAVAGAMGRTGRAVLELAGRDQRFQVVAALTDKNDPLCGTSVRVGDTEVAVVDKLGVTCEVLVDFTTAVGSIEWLDVCERFEIPMVIGSTGHDESHWARIRKAARVIPIVKAANFSVGIQLVVSMIGKLARELGDAYNIELIETHHRHKLDAPSGTALMLLDALLEATGRSRDADVVFGRKGAIGVRPARQIGVHAIRLGEIVGRHEVHFGGPGETLTITHAVQSRETFAAGALRAAAWIIEQKPGLYSLQDVLGGEKSGSGAS